MKLLSHYVTIILFYLCFGIPATLYANLIGHWAFETLDEDSSGNNYTLTLEGAPIQSPGVIGQAINLNGTNDQAAVPDMGSTHTQLTVSAWVNTRKPDIVSQGIFHHSLWQAGTPHFLLEWYNSPSSDLTGIVIGMPGNEIKRHAADSMFAGDTWYHVAWTYDNGQLSLYIGYTNDPTLQYVSFGAAENIDLTSMYIGGGFGRYFSGRIDDVAVWNTPLSGAWVRALCQLATSQFNYNAGQVNDMMIAFEDEADVTVNDDPWMYTDQDVPIDDYVPGDVFLDRGTMYLLVNIKYEEEEGAGFILVPEPATGIILLVFTIFFTRRKFY